jgi:hypothetical protein
MFSKEQAHSGDVRSSQAPSSSKLVRRVLYRQDRNPYESYQTSCRVIGKVVCDSLVKSSYMASSPVSLGSNDAASLELSRPRWKLPH